jgi:hypothetical protein
MCGQSPAWDFPAHADPYVQPQKRSLPYAAISRKSSSPGGALTVRFQPSIVLSALGSPCYARTVKRLSHSGFPQAWHQLTRGSYFHRLTAIRATLSRSPCGWLLPCQPQSILNPRLTGVSEGRPESSCGLSKCGDNARMEFSGLVSTPVKASNFRDRGGLQC